MVKLITSKITKNKQLTLLVLLATIIPFTTIALTYGVLKTRTVTTVTQGVSGDTIYIDDQNEDYYYYTGQNYTSSQNGALPTRNDKNIYNDNNLVHTIITYNGKSYSNNYTGYVSLTEQQSKFKYYKYYPVENNYIEIELIDNPFNDHPNDLVFNGWQTDYQGATIQYDPTYYTRTLKVPVTYDSNGVPNDININIYANWSEGKIAQLNSGETFTTAQNKLDSDGMHKIETTTNIYEYPEVQGYYKRDTITTTVTITGRWPRQTRTTDYGTCTDCYDENMHYHNSYQCPEPNLQGYVGAGTYPNNCTIYYLQDSNDEFDSSATYYSYKHGTLTQLNLQPTLIGTETKPLYTNTLNMSGYYRKKTINYGESIAGYYNNMGQMQTGTCQTRAGCQEYELIQFYKQNNEQETYDSQQEYYYLTTRDTNIIVMKANTSTTWGSSENKPFTLTGIHNDHNYNPTWNVSEVSVNCYNATRIEEMTITSEVRNSNSSPTSSSSSSGTFYANRQNAKLGRNIKQDDTYTNFRYIIGSKADDYTIGSSSNPEKYRLIVESGNYNSTSLTLGATNYSYTTVYTEMQGIYGNDYDRATNNNNKLTIYYCASGSWSGDINSSNNTLIPALTTIVKSGSFGTSKYDLTTGIYVGGRYAGNQYSPRTVKVEGGYIYNLIGGPLSVSNHSNINDIYIYMTGGTVDLVTGGAGTSTTYGNRIIQITGGTVNYSVFGGSNGSDGSSTDGTLTGSSYVYIGGKATIGNEDNITNNRKLFGAESGSVFGAGNGNETYPSIGSVDNSNVIISDEAVIKQNVYGSGNYGTVGYSSSQNGQTHIKILEGTINGSVFGSGNNSGSGKAATSGYNSTPARNIDVTIEMEDGQVVNGIYGGSNQEGILHGNTTINVTGGTIKDIYGGGLGAETYVEKNVTVNISSQKSQLDVTGSIYGGSAFGTVNSTTHSTTTSNYDTNVTVNSGNINNVFGGGQGDNSHTPYVCGDVTLTINGGTVTNAFGGNDAAGQPNGTVSVYLNGGTVTNAYGGGNNTGLDETNVYQTGATITNLFGGSNASGNVTTSNVTITGGRTTNAYGGNNSGGTTHTSNVEISNGTVTELYGGGNQAETNETNVDITGGTVTTTYGGGRAAGVTTTATVNMSAGNVTTIYGGSNTGGSVHETEVNIRSGTVQDVYGGNNQAGTTATTNVNLNGGRVTSAYGGGNQTATTTSNVTLAGSTVTNIYGGGNQAGVTTTNISLQSGTGTNVYGGSNASGTVTTSNITSTNTSNLTVSNVYGGNNQGGTTTTTNVTLNGGTYNNIYGGGNLAQTGTTNVTVNGITVTEDFFGGGNQAGVTNNTNVDFINSTIQGDIFGGGNLGVVGGNTDVYISHSTIRASAYGGGNGTTAVVRGNTKISVDNNSTITNHVFGGGNAANTGIEDDGDDTTTNDNSSTSTVNIAGGTIHGNVYGGANTAVIYGTTSVNVGYNVNNLTKTNVQIDGTVFGGGEANAEGSEEYDFDFINVTVGTDVHIDGGNYNNFNINGSIFGSGNAANCEGYKRIEIENYGTFDNYKSNISIQRADTLTIKNSAIKLSGTTDRTNEFSTVAFSLSRIDDLKLANNSTLFLQTGTNLVKKFESLLINGSTSTKAAVTITEDGTTTRNVDNRIYMLESKNMNIATNQAITDYGEVSGMAFLGMYKTNTQGHVVTALYDKDYENGDSVNSGELYTFTSGSYVLGLHNENHNIEVDGFYSNFADEENEGTIITKYIEPTPSNADFYMWVVGESVTTYDVNLNASKYSTLGTYELSMISSSGANTTFEVIGFNYQDLAQGFTLTNPNNISRINTNGNADDLMALAIESPNTGYVEGGETTFQTNENTPINGTRNYITENSDSNPPSLLFSLYHSKNLTQTRTIGTAVITLLAIKPIDALNNEVKRININVTLTSSMYDSNDYEGAMTTGEKYSLFTSTATNITTESTFSAYYGLYMESANEYYKTGYHHSLVSSYVFPEGTKITMIDLSNGPTYYYYVIDQAAVTSAQQEYNRYGECSYDLSNFVQMGSTSPQNNYDETKNNQRYYNTDLNVVDEEFIFNVNFEDTEIEGNHTNNTLLIELRNQSNQTLIGVLGIQHSNLTYSLYDSQKAIIDLDGTLNPNKIYLKDSTTLNLTGRFTQPTVGTLPVVDTTYLNKKAGIRITLYDSNGNLLNNSSLFGISYEIRGVKYYPRMDGSVRIALAQRVANIAASIKIDTQSVSLPSGNYTMKIESFGSADGIYYGLTPSDTLNLPFTIVNSRYGLNVELPDNQKTVDKSTGLTPAKTNILDFTTNYSSQFERPKITVQLYRRNYNEVYDKTYTKVNITDYVTNQLENYNYTEYMFISNPNTDLSKRLYLKPNLTSGTYRFRFNLYDNTTLIGSSDEYIVIK